MRLQGTRHANRPVGFAFSAAIVSASGGACAAAPSTLQPAGPGAATIAVLWWVLLALGSIATLVVIVLLGIALVARPSSPADSPVSSRRGNILIIGGGVVLPAVMIPVVLAITFATMAAFPPIGTDWNPRNGSGHDLTVRIIAHQFWWEVVYPDFGVVTANEIQMPVDQPVRFEITSEDVIHSFWVPQLQGKIDALPDRDTFVVLQADETGRFRGICAEFCGIQHAHMYFHVVVRTDEEFSAWLERQRQPAPEPVEPQVQRGHDVFMASCAGCHAIEGTDAVAREGPNLTRLMSREWIASGMLQNTTENLTAFVEDPQGIKPGNLMPAVAMTSEDLVAVIAFLETLE